MKLNYLLDAFWGPVYLIKRTICTAPGINKLLHFQETSSALKLELTNRGDFVLHAVFHTFWLNKWKLYPDRGPMSQDNKFIEGGH